MYIPLEEGEEIVAKVHRHWVFIALRIVALVVGAFLPLLAIALVRAVGLVQFSSASSGAVLTLWALWVLVLWTVFWQFWTTYYMDIWVITSRRIIDIDYQRLFDRQISMLELERVQDITTHVAGLWATLFRYGSVIVQTAGTQEEFVIDQITDPEGLRNIISGLVERANTLPHNVRVVS